MLVAGKQIKKNKIKRTSQMIFFFFFFYDGDMMIMCVCVCVFSSSYKSFCSVIVYI
jgi:hypothetical protein